MAFSEQHLYFDDVQIGQAVTVVFQDTENGAPVPMFTPA